MEANGRMKDYRDKLRKQGLKPVQIWVPDQREAGFREALRRQIASLNADEEQESLQFISRVAEWPES